MKYYQFICGGNGGIKSKELALTTVKREIDFFDTSKVKLQEPVEVEAVWYHPDDKESDYVIGGNPQIVSEEFKNLVEELDPNAAQFFETVSINCVTKKKYYLMHVTQTIYCLDRNKSAFILQDIAKGAIDSSKVPESCHMFRLGEETAWHYVSGTFVKEYKKRKLKGCKFLLRSWEDVD